MIAAYVYHIINLTMSFLMISILLSNLSAVEYSYWIVFSTIAGFGLQIQGAIQTVTIREISLEFHTIGIGASLERTKKSYNYLCKFMIGPLLLAGAIYFYKIGANNLVITSWIIYVATYVAIYYFAPNNALLLGTDNLKTNSNINSISRVSYICSAWTLLGIKGSIFYVCIAFLISAIVSISLNIFATKSIKIHSPDPHFKSTSITTFSIFSISSFAIYNGTILFGFFITGKGYMASYSLIIQIATILLAVSTVPAQAWIGRLSRALGNGNLTDAKRQLLLSVIAGNIVFIASASAVYIFGDDILNIINARISLPINLIVAAVLFSFFVELNILMLCNFLVSAKNLTFVTPYLCSAALAVSLASAVAFETGNVFWLVAAAFPVQLLIALPAILLIVRKELHNARPAPV